MITLQSTGDFKNTSKFLNGILKVVNKNILDKYGQRGVEALSASTPVDTGLASKSWYYKTFMDKEQSKIVWYNSDIEDNNSVVILLQYGHATKNGGFVQGIDFINPAIKPIFEQIKNDIWKEIKNT